MKYLSITLKNDHVLVDVDQIMYLMADKSYTWIYLKNGEKYLSSKNLGKFDSVLIEESELPSNKFFRIHHGTIINTRYISKFNIKESLIKLRCGEEFNIAQRKRVKFRKVLSEFTNFV